MKKHLFFAATAALVLASCSSDSVDFTQADVLQAQDDNSVQFDTYMGKVASTRTDAYSKGPIVNDEPSNANSLKNAMFGVFAYQTSSDYVNGPTPTTLAPNFMYNQQITWNASSPAAWVYSPVKYWPNGIDAANGGANPSNTATSNNNDKLSFFAVAPFTTTPTTDYNESWYGSLPTAISYAGYVKTNGATNGINSMTTNGFTGNVWVKYLMPKAQEDEAVDLLWGTNGKTSYNETDNTNPTLSSSIGDGYNMNLTKQYVGEKVKFLFKHALAKIGGNTETTTEEYDKPAPSSCGYQIKLDVDGNNGDNQTSFFGSTSAFTNTKTLVTVEKVEIMDGASAATAGIATSGTTSNLAKSGWFNIEQGKWDATTVTTGATYSITADNTNTNVNDATYSLNPDIKEGAVSVKTTLTASDNWSKTSGDNAYTGGATGVIVDAQPLFAKENVPGLMVIPGGSQTIYVRIKYYVRTLDANLNKKYTEVAQTITNKVDLSSLESNKYYKIIMHLGLTSVKFEAVVADWETYNNGTFDENGNYTPGGVATPNETKVWLPSNVVSYAVTVPVAYNVTPYSYATATHNIGDVKSGTNAGNITAVTTNSTTSTTADITLNQNNTTATVSSTTTITCELGKVVLTIQQAPVAITATCDNYTISHGNAVTLTVTNSGTSSAISAGSYTVGVYTDSECTNPAAAANYTDTTGSDGKVTFSATGTYYIKVTSGESKVTTTAITVS